ncbi:MAG TPA: hypothetical protein VLM86_00410, partial [Candidatus Bathyarchaeia archaeon]|nr:hypothetical protein [Candidatus Bathyarchaeia archaeon]
MQLSGSLLKEKFHAVPGREGGSQVMAHRARRLLDDARKAIAATEKRIRSHPYLEALEARAVRKKKLALFAGQQRHIIESDLRSVALIVSRAESQDARDFLTGMLQGERSALTALGAFGHDDDLVVTDELADIFEADRSFPYGVAVMGGNRIDKV